MDISLGDDTKKIFLNAKGFLEEANEDLQAFLEYVAGKESKNDFVQEIKKEAIKVKHGESCRRDFMMQHMRDHLKIEEGKEIGEAIGKELGKETTIICTIRRAVEQKMSLEVLVELLKIEEDYVTEVIQLFEEYPKATDEELVNIIMSQNVQSKETGN